jgi:integrase
MRVSEGPCRIGLLYGLKQMGSLRFRFAGTIWTWPMAASKVSRPEMPSVHPLTGTELRALRRLQREQEPGRYLFMSERGAPISAVGFRRMMGTLGKAARMPFPVHPHMLRHACGFKLANDGQDTRALQHFLGHKNIQHTVRYTELSPERFKDFWTD